MWIFDKTKILNDIDTKIYDTVSGLVPPALILIPRLSKKLEVRSFKKRESLETKTSHFAHLSIEGIPLQLVNTLKVMSVALGHDKAVLFPFEIVSFIEHRLSAASEVPFSLNVDVCFR